MSLLQSINPAQISSFVEPSLNISQGNYLDHGHCLFRFINEGYCNSSLLSTPSYLDLGGALAAFGLIFTVYQLRNPIWDTVLSIRSTWQRYSFWAFGIIGLLLILSRVLVTQIPVNYLSYPFDVPILYEVLAYIFFALSHCRFATSREEGEEDSEMEIRKHEKDGKGRKEERWEWREGGNQKRANPPWLQGVLSHC